MSTSIGKMQSNATFNMCIAKRFFYIACLNNDMFRPLYRPYYIILNTKFIDVHEISLTKTKKQCILYTLLYNKEVYNLMMADIEGETCSC